jgi:hypothetical protein
VTARPRPFRRTLEELYAAHCILWNLGFSPEEICVSAPHVTNGDPPGHYATLTLERDGRSFIYNLPPRLEQSEETPFLEAWLAFADSVRKVPQAKLDRMVRRSEVWRRKHEMLAVLALKGFRFVAVES